MIYVAVVIVVVLLLTSETYGEVPVLILTFVVALVVNQGTNYLLGKISFVSNSVTSILQLALSIRLRDHLLQPLQGRAPPLPHPRGRHRRAQQVHPGDRRELPHHGRAAWLRGCSCSSSSGPDMAICLH